MVQSVLNCELIQSSGAGTRSLLEEHMTEETSVLASSAPSLRSAVTFKATRFYGGARRSKQAARVGQEVRDKKSGRKEKIEDPAYF